MAEKVISGRAFVKALQDAGLLPPRTESVIIEAHVNGLPTITYRCIGDERLLEIVDGIDDSDPSPAL